MARALAHEQVVARAALLHAGVPRWVPRLELRSGRWRPGGRQSLVLHNGPWLPATRRAVAVLEVGRAAALDGTSALQHAGLTGLDHDGPVTVSTPKGSTPRHPRGVRVRETRRFREGDVVQAGVRRMRPAVAALHAALWAVTDRQAVLFLTMTVQQRLASAAEIAEALQEVRRDRRRGLITRVLVELAGGAGSLGELDVVAGLRRRGLPEPTRQAVRKRPSGREYLDCEFRGYRLVLEIDGADHDKAAQRLSDVLRDVRLAAEGQTVIRIPLIAWRLDEEAVLDGLEQLFTARGWAAPAAA